MVGIKDKYYCGTCKADLRDYGMNMVQTGSATAEIGYNSLYGHIDFARFGQDDVDFEPDKSKPFVCCGKCNGKLMEYDETKEQNEAINNIVGDDEEDDDEENND